MNEERVCIYNTCVDVKAEINAVDGILKVNREEGRWEERGYAICVRWSERSHRKHEFLDLDKAYLC